jgi:hypothetical protein
MHRRGAAVQRVLAPEARQEIGHRRLHRRQRLVACARRAPRLRQVVDGATECRDLVARVRHRNALVSRGGEAFELLAKSAQLVAQRREIQVGLAVDPAHGHDARALSLARLDAVGE